MTSFILTGPMGAGKTTVARLVAQQTGLALIDCDQEIERLAGKPVQQIFVDDGEPAFRALERRTVAEAIARPDVVVALGGGAVMDPDTQADLLRAGVAGAVVVFLDVPAAAAAHRVGLGAGRPLLLGNPRATWIALMARRRPVYERVATLVVQTGELTPAQIAQQILDASGERPTP